MGWAAVRQLITSMTGAVGVDVGQVRGDRPAEALEVLHRGEGQHDVDRAPVEVVVGAAQLHPVDVDDAQVVQLADPIPATGAHLEQGRLHVRVRAGRQPPAQEELAHRLRALDEGRDPRGPIRAAGILGQGLQVGLHLGLQLGAPGLDHRLVDEAEARVAREVGDRLDLARLAAVSRS